MHVHDCAAQTVMHKSRHTCIDTLAPEHLSIAIRDLSLPVLCVHSLEHAGCVILEFLFSQELSSRHKLVADKFEYVVSRAKPDQ